MGLKEMDKFLKEQKKDIPKQKPKYDNCVWYYTVLVWETNPYRLEVIISKDNDKIKGHIAQFDDPANWGESKPEVEGGEGIKLHQKIYRFTAGKTRGPHKNTVIKKAKIPSSKRRGLKITNLDKE